MGVAAERKGVDLAPVSIPAYLNKVYWWAYVHPRAVRFFERQWLVNLILWGNFGALRDAALAAMGARIEGRALQVAVGRVEATESQVLADARREDHRVLEHVHHAAGHRSDAAINVDCRLGHRHHQCFPDGAGRSDAPALPVPSGSRAR